MAMINAFAFGGTGSPAVLLALDTGVTSSRIRPDDTVLLLAIEASRYVYAGLSLRWRQPLRA
jgi:3-oxoacyl-[acyl-carrier-protein] synthase III